MRFWITHARMFSGCTCVARSAAPERIATHRTSAAAKRGIVMAMLLLMGCQNITTGSSGTSSSTATPAVQTQQIRPTANDMVVKHSHLPIDYLINARVIVRVDDLTTNKHLFMQQVGNNTYVRVDTHGIRLNNAHVYTGTLKAGDTYEIVLVRANGF